MNLTFAQSTALLCGLLLHTAFADEISSLDPLSYDYVYFDAASGSQDGSLGDNSDVTELAVGGFYPLSERWILTGDYRARFVHLEGTTAENYILLPGVGAYFPLGERLDLVVDAKAGGVRYVLSDDDTDDNLDSSTDWMLGGGVYLRYALTDQLQLGGTVKLNRSDRVDEDIFQLKIDYRFNKLFGLGGFYTYTDYGHNSENAGGLSARVYY